MKDVTVGGQQQDLTHLDPGKSSSVTRAIGLTLPLYYFMGVLFCSKWPTTTISGCSTCECPRSIQSTDTSEASRRGTHLCQRKAIQSYIEETFS